MGQGAPAGDWRPDGIILRDSERLEEMLAYGVPTVVVGHSKEQVPGVVNIITDSDRIGWMAAEHLAWLRTDASSPFADSATGPGPGRRLQRVFGPAVPGRSSLRSRSRATKDPGLNGWQEELAGLADWLEGLPKPVGVMGCNDDRAHQVIEACKLAGLRVPEEVAVIGADNDELVCDLADPPLTSVAINFERAGYEAAASSRPV